MLDLEVAFGGLLHGVTVVHRIRGNVLEGWLKLAAHHDVLLDELHIAAILFRQLLLLADGDGIVGVIAIPAGLH